MNPATRAALDISETNVRHIIDTATVALRALAEAMAIAGDERAAQCERAMRGLRDCARELAEEVHHGGH